MADNFLSNGKVSTFTNFRAFKNRVRATTSPKFPLPIGEYLDFLENEILPHAVNMASPRCVGHMTSMLPEFAKILSTLITALNQNLVKTEASKAFTFLERQTIGMLHSLIYKSGSDFYRAHAQNKESTLGVMASGGTIANITAMWIARDTSPSSSEKFAAEESKAIHSAQAHPICGGSVIIGSSLMHYSFAKAANLLGFGDQGLRKVPVDAYGRMNIRALCNTVDECLAQERRIVALIGIAGSTDCGSVDPLLKIADIAAEAGVHFHVDAALGAPLIFSRTYRDKLAGIERADSISVDGHKQMCLPLGSSLLLLKNPHSAKSIRQHAPYMLQEQSEDLGKYSFEGSRPGTSLYFHAGLHIIGSSGYETLVDQNIYRAQVMSRVIRQTREFELLLEPETNIVIYRYIPRSMRAKRLLGTLTNDDNTQISVANKTLQKAQYHAGRCYVSRTLVEYAKAYPGLSLIALRVIFGNPLTREEDIKLVLDDQVCLAKDLCI